MLPPVDVTTRPSKARMKPGRIRRDGNLGEAGIDVDTLCGSDAASTNDGKGKPKPDVWTQFAINRGNRLASAANKWSSKRV